MNLADKIKMVSNMKKQLESMDFKTEDYILFRAEIFELEREIDREKKQGTFNISAKEEIENSLKMKKTKPNK